ncbi:uncharacterized protein TNIN_170291 [Trichonephila inaurata madagascariensis]|uniref:C2H2-type domain-containing protein n=1 Tax=Trichonephila inaurata madagascariensis TaxID=2747483 RepID=A0A8X6XUV8_9ARAC|nr:uncharacterized protein TNIN_170291 [Trichonephila inaurata madagascariensis]
MRTHTGKKTHSCDLHNKGFSRKDSLQRHRLTHFNITNQQSTSNAVSKRRLIPSQMPPSKKRKPDNSAHALNVFTITTFDSITDNELDFLKFFDYVRAFIFEELQSKLKEKRLLNGMLLCKPPLREPHRGKRRGIYHSHFGSNCVVGKFKGKHNR